jgi:hypothetical protein
MLAGLTQLTWTPRPWQKHIKYKINYFPIYQRIEYLVRPEFHVTWVACYHGMARPPVAVGEDGLQIWRVAVNTLNKQSRTADRGWSSSLGVGRGANNPPTLKPLICYEPCHRGWGEGVMAGCRECGDEPSGSGTTELFRLKLEQKKKHNNNTSSFKSFQIWNTWKGRRTYRQDLHFCLNFMSFTQML